MSKKFFNVLIIDDHPIIADAYKSAFEFISSENKKIKFKISIANTSDQAVEIIEDSYENKGLDIFF